jgi:hypothetical protein
MYWLALMLLAALSALPVPAFAADGVQGQTGTFPQQSNAYEADPAQGCSRDDALEMLSNEGLAPVVELPLLPEVFRFIARTAVGKGLVAAMVTREKCRLRTDGPVLRKRPWCEYVPGPAPRCPGLLSR